MRYLVHPNGFIGDTLFASSIASKLREQDASSEVDYVISLPQPYLLLKQNPFIREVYLPSDNVPNNHDRTVYLPLIDQSRPATIQLQEAAGITNPTLGYQVYTVPEYDSQAAEQIGHARHELGKKVIAWQSNWKERAYATTKEQNESHIGGPHRDIEFIVSELAKTFTLYEVGLTNGIDQRDPRAADYHSYARTASIIKQCDWFIGSEGGLSNLAAGVGTKCIITTDFIYQVYGENGFVKQIKYPRMGPCTYFPKGGHVHLYPWLRDAEVVQCIAEIVNESIDHRSGRIIRVETG